MARYVCVANDKYLCVDQCWCCVANSDQDPPTRCLYRGKKHRIACWIKVEDDHGEPTDFAKYAEDPAIRHSPTFVKIDLCGKEHQIDTKN